ncbi:MAG TPA: tetratricopeptide repeat protein [Caulobacteraceae bacterium]|nr:tetratricopeptide repeat protein [Caulobacteraceae bacterium]
MSRTPVKTSASPNAAEMAPPSGRPVVDDAASPAALSRLAGAIGELRALAVAPMLRQALDCLKAEDAKAGSEWALKALELDPRSGMAWYVLAVAREKAGDFGASLKAYESALALAPDRTDVANDLGRLAFRMGLKDVAEQLFRRYLEANPASFEAANNLACALRDQSRSAEAIDVLKAAIKASPNEALLWNTLGTVVCEQGELRQSVIFFEEALRLAPDFAKARYNHGNALLGLGELEAALCDCQGAMAQAESEDDRLMMQLARSTIQICRGRIGDGWDDYEARLHPRFADSTRFLVDRPRWTPEADLQGKTLLLMGEQGLGDEVLFANLVPDVLDALGPGGKLVLALEPRLVELFRRSFPDAQIGAHATWRIDGRTLRGAPFLGSADEIDLWAPLASPLRRFRRSLDAFPRRERFLVADPARVRRWRKILASAPPGRKVGIVWKSLNLDGARSRYYSPFDLWAPVLKTPGVSFVNIQYGDCAAELEFARRQFGVDIWEPPGIDLKNDLDEVAALTCALDLTLGFANASSNIAAACGAPTWIVSVPGAWTRLGTDQMPWYPQARVFLPSGFGRWGEAMDEIAAALARIDGPGGTGPTPMG